MFLKIHTFRIKEQETRLNLREHDDDDDEKFIHIFHSYHENRCGKKYEIKYYELKNRTIYK